MNKKYEIKTVDDILDVVNQDNVDNFIKDFENWIRIYLTIKNIVDFTGGNVEHQKFIWIDDGKHNAQVILSEDKQ